MTLGHTANSDRFPRLDPLPPSFAATVESLHRVAERLVAAARKPDDEISLRATPGGFGTPVFELEGAEHRVRVEGAELVHDEGGTERRAPLTSLAAAAEAVAGLLPADAQLDEEPLSVDPAASRALGSLYAFAAALLDELVEEADPDDAPTIPRLWPEHFDIAIELGPEAAGLRANYGASPGDADHDEPYLYVGPWTAEVAGELWNGRGFRGAELVYSELLGRDDPAAAAREFFRTRRNALTATESKETK
ncbi:MAG: hypothetical protein ACM3N0_05885 [Chloroflexota bacterium]